jgi:hypothetical protein
LSAAQQQHAFLRRQLERGIGVARGEQGRGEETSAQDASRRSRHGCETVGNPPCGVKSGRSQFKPLLGYDRAGSDKASQARFLAKMAKSLSTRGWQTTDCTDDTDRQRLRRWPSSPQRLGRVRRRGDAEFDSKRGHRPKMAKFALLSWNLELGT